MQARLLEGFGPLLFGADTSECLSHFGEPDEKEQLEGADGSLSNVWHYWDKGFSLFFEDENGDRFCCVEIDEAFPLLLYNEEVFGKPEAEIIKLLSTKGYSVTDTEHHEWGERRISFDDIFADFYFEDGKLVSLNYSMPLNN